MSAADLRAPLSLAETTFRPISLADLPRIASAAETSGAWLWASYGPFLLAFGESPARAVLLGDVAGGIAVLVRRRIRGRDHVDLVIPPLSPDCAAALDDLVPALAAYNGPKLETRVLWADLPAVAWAQGREGWEVRPYEREYVYDRRLVLAMAGGEFRMLRKRINRCERESSPEIRPFRAEDRPACIALLKEWQAAREGIVAPVFDFGYTIAAIELADRIPESHMTGIVAEIEGTIRAFAFGGPIRPGVGQFFVLKSDPEKIGLAETMRVELLRRLEGCDLVNDAGDLDRPGLAQHKREFRPVAFVPTGKMAWKGMTDQNVGERITPTRPESDRGGGAL